jgi:hypothetical protein
MLHFFLYKNIFVKSTSPRALLNVSERKLHLSDPSGDLLQLVMLCNEGFAKDRSSMFLRSRVINHNFTRCNSPESYHSTPKTRLTAYRSNLITQRKYSHTKQHHTFYTTDAPRLTQFHVTQIQICHRISAVQE